MINSMQKDMDEIDEIESAEFEDEPQNSRPVSRQGRGRPRKNNEVRLGLAKDTYLGYKIEKGNYIYSDDQIVEAFFDKYGNMEKTAAYLQISPRWLLERVYQNPALRVAQNKAKELFNEIVESKLMDLCLKGDAVTLKFWIGRRGGVEWAEKKEVNSTNKNMNMNLNIDLSKLSDEELQDVRAKLNSTINNYPV